MTTRPTNKMSATTRLCYNNIVALAPMVRIGTLPSRLLALRYGADVAYTEEIIDHKMCLCRRVKNNLLDTVDFVLPDDTVVLRTCSEEKDRVIFQMGTSDPDRALRTAKLVSRDVAGIDVNMGCPKAFSLKGGMGSALLTQPEKVRSILTTLVNGIPNVPITCKIRLLPTKEETLHLIRVITSTGVAAIGVHGRLQQQKSQVPISDEHQSWIREIAAKSPVPIIANGGSLDIKNRKDILDFRDSVGCTSVMVARSAQWNLSVFRTEGPLPATQVARDYLELAVRYRNDWGNSKYCLMMMIHKNGLGNLGEDLHRAKGLKEISMVWDCQDVYERGIAQRKKKAAELGLALPDSEQDELDGPASKRPRVERIDDRDVTVMDISYDPREFPNGVTPKGLLINYSTRYKKDKPVYTSEVVNSKFVATVRACGGRFHSSIAASNKRKAEQAAALVCLRALNLQLNPDGSEIKAPSAETAALTDRLIS